jgi:hypothetical protein
VVVAGLENVANAIGNFVKTIWEKVEHFFRGSGGIGNGANPTAPDAPGRASPMSFPGDSPSIRPTFIDSRSTTVRPTLTFGGYPQQQNNKPITLAATLTLTARSWRRRSQRS